MEEESGGRIAYLFSLVGGGVLVVVVGRSFLPPFSPLELVGVLFVGPVLVPSSLQLLS